ncbi:MAG TPA: hypothetical protein VI731_04185 [Bacteroidia bacterium]|nr:hypothetical protein [Bacteroidia bacterium]
MKQSLFFFQLFLSALLAAQQYVPMPIDSNVRWRVTYYINMPGCNSYPNAEYEYSIPGDTIIGMHTYGKLFRSGVIYDCPPDASGIGYVGAIREDSNKRVYIVFPNTVSDTLLYDFNLAVGDTVRGYLADPASAGDFPVVAAIDSVLTGTVYRKRYSMVPMGFDQADLIEGIGTTNGVLDWYGTGYNQAYELCFVYNNVTLFQTPSAICSPITVSSEPVIITPELSVSPIPATTEISISLSNWLADERITVLLTDAGGRSYRNETFVTSDGKISMSRAGLSAGVYFVTVLSNDFEYRGKVIFQ